MIKESLFRYKNFFIGQAQAQDKEHMKSRRARVMDLFASDFLNSGYVTDINESNGRIVVKFRKGCAPRLKYLKSFVVIYKNARTTYGENILSWTCSFDEFIKQKSCYSQASDIQAITYISCRDQEHDYVECGSISLEMYSFLKDAIHKGISPQVLLFDNYPPKDFYLNMCKFMDIYGDTPELSMLGQSIDYNSWDPIPLRYDPKNESAIADTLYNTLQNESCCILQGPPGTGKSYTIAQIINRYLEEGKSVCSTTMTNKGLVELCQQEPLTKSVAAKLVSKTRLSADERKRVPGLEAAGKKILPVKGHLLCTTNYILSMVYNNDGDEQSPIDEMFDLVVIEEASQTFLTTILAFRKLGIHCLVVGDPKQLPPIISDEDNQMLNVADVESQKRGLEAYAVASGVTSYVVTTSFRLTKKSAALTSIFYPKGITSVQKKRVEYAQMDTTYFPKEGGALYHVTDCSPNGTYSRPALEVMKAIINTLEQHYPETELAIICPYTATAKYIQREFQTSGRKIDITIETIDRVQGMTVDYCIFYIPGDNTRFSLNEKRFNVATSRSRGTTLIISDLELENTYKFKGLVKEYILNCTRV